MKTAPLTPFFEPVFRLWFTMLAIVWLGSPLFAQTGPNYAGQVVNDASAGNLAWTNLSNAIGSIDDDIHASTPTMATNDQSNYLKATDFGFVIPAFHAIDGIEVDIEWHRTGGNIRDIEVFLVVGGLIQTIQNSGSNTRIPNGPPDGVDSYGGPTDLWGLTLADTDVEDAGFGVAVRVRRQGTGGGAPPHQPMVDRISITVYHKLDDKDPTNELNTNLTLSGTSLELTDAGGTLTQDLSTLNDALQAEVDQNKLDIAANTAAITSNDSEISSLQSDVATNTADITNNSTAIGANTNGIANNAAAISANDADITALQSDVATNSSDIANNSTTIGANTTDIVNNTAAISANDADIIALQSDVATNSSDITNNSTAITANDADITVLQSVVSTNTTDITTNATNIAANANAIAADSDGDSGNELNTSLTLNGTDLELTDAGGLLSVDLSSFSTNSIQDEIADADGNTRIQVEASPNEDIIRFEVGGTERWIMTGNRLEPSDIWNTFIGHQAGSSTTTGQQNTFLGKEAGRDNTTGETNVFLGEQAGKSNTSGWANTITGKDAGTFIQTGHRNAYYGYGSGAQNISGADNTMLGYLTGVNSTGSRNVFLGNQAGHSETGDDKLYIDNSSTSTPLIWGDFASDILRVNGTLNINNAYSFPLTVGSVNQVLSVNGIGNLTWRTINPAIVKDADNDTKIQVEESSDEDVIRFDVGGTERWVMTGARLEPSDIWNTFIGHTAGSSNTTGTQNTFIGKNAGASNSTGIRNTFLGGFAGHSNSSGQENTFIGVSAGNLNQTGKSNTYTGFAAGAQNVTGSFNTFIGHRAGALNTGHGNIFLGHHAGYNESGDNKLYIDNSSTNTPLIWGDFATDILRVNGTLNINNAYNFPKADGSVGQVLASDGAGNITWQTTEVGAINDADNDTKIHVEKNTDEDIIRFDLGGVERWQMQGTRLIPINSWKSTFVGAASGKNDIGNTNNTFFGYETGFMNTSGADNTFVGREAGRNNDVGTYNVFLGSRAGISNVDANENTYLGYGAGAFSTNGSENTAVGFLAGNQNLTGIQNTIVGNEAGYLNTGSANVFLGYQVGYNETGSDKLYIDNSSTSTPLIWGDFATNVLRVNGTFNINNAYSFPTSDGLANQILTSDGAGTVSWQSLGNDELKDADNDTKIQLEATTDEDIIRFEIGGTEQWRMEGTRLTSLNTGGSVFIGNQAGVNDDLASNVNVFIGEESGKSNTAGDHNTFIGSRSGELNTVGSFNTMLGSFAGAEHSNGVANTYVGANAGRRNSNGVGNTFIGSQAMFNNVYGTHNTILGNNAGINTTGNRNVFIGNSVGPVGAVDDQLYIDNTNTNTPLIWGDFASDVLKVHGTLNVNDAYNLPTSDGLAGQVLQTDGSGNASWQLPNVDDADSDPTNEFLTGATLIGTNLEISDAGGTHVVDLITLTAGGNSSAIFDMDGDTRIQTEANPNEDIIRFQLANTERWKMLDSRIESVNSGGSIFMGEDAGKSDDLSTNNNVFIGHLAGQANISGENNVFLGHWAGYNSTTSFNNTSVGLLAGTSFIGGHNNTSLGYGANGAIGFDVSNSTAVGTNAQNTATFQIRLGHSAITSIGGFSNWTNLSDARLKKDIQDSGIGLDFIMKLRPVSYHLDMDAISSRLNTPEDRRDLEAEEVKANILQTGFLAQEVEQAAKELGYDFSGVDAPKNDKDFYGLRYAEFVVPLVKGMQEQQAQIETLEQENADLRTRLASIEEALIRLGAEETGSSEKFQRHPEQMILHQNVPNPFDRQTRISYELPGAGQVQLSIYTQQNALVQILVSEHQEAGEYTVEWNADSYSAGVYLYVLTQNGQQLAKRMMVLK